MIIIIDYSGDAPDYDDFECTQVSFVQADDHQLYWLLIIIIDYNGDTPDYDDYECTQVSLVHTDVHDHQLYWLLIIIIDYNGDVHSDVHDHQLYWLLIIIIDYNGDTPDYDDYECTQVSFVPVDDFLMMTLIMMIMSVHECTQVSFVPAGDDNDFVVDDNDGNAPDDINDD